MENKKIFLVLTLFMGVALADDDDPGFFRDRTAPKKWSFFERSKESDHKTERYQQPQKFARVKNDDNGVEYYCNSKYVVKRFDNWKTQGKTYYPVWEEFYERVCDVDLNDNSVTLDDGQRCFANHDDVYYCYTIEREFEVPYWCFFCFPKNKIITLRIGCGCGFKPSLQKR